ncbi:MAG: hypothetical protein WD716_11125 [Fimbriimonadaceae bacterium]
MLHKVALEEHNAALEELNGHGEEHNGDLEELNGAREEQKVALEELNGHGEEHNAAPEELNGHGEELPGPRRSCQPPHLPVLESRWDRGNPVGCPGYPPGREGSWPPPGFDQELDHILRILPYTHAYGKQHENH